MEEDIGVEDQEGDGAEDRDGSERFLDGAAKAESDRVRERACNRSCQGVFKGRESW